MQFNGSSALVTIPDAASLHLTTGMTLEAWVNPSTVNGNWRDVIYKGNDNYYLEATSTNASKPDAGLIAGGSYADAYGSAALTANTWTYLAETYDGATLRLYVNGTQVASTAHTGTISASTNPLQIGGDSLYGQNFAGMIDEVRIYNTALTPTQIQTDQTTPVTPTGPTYSVGGSVSGLSGTVVLQDNGGDDLSVSANGPFTFATKLASGAAYAVTVKTNPSGQTCARVERLRHDRLGQRHQRRRHLYDDADVFGRRVGVGVVGDGGLAGQRRRRSERERERPVHVRDQVGVRGGVRGDGEDEPVRTDLRASRTAQARSARPTSPTSPSPVRRRRRFRSAGRCRGCRGRWCCRTTAATI